jgi:glycosyltransferase involved in cell wall biosynthesis
MTTPLVSCLCVTEKRVAQLERAIDCFMNQSYENKEMIIIYQESDLDTLRLISKLLDVRIKILCAPSGTEVTLGGLRNFSVSKSSGDYFIQWDDNDWHHKDRIKLQMESVFTFGREASVLTNIILFYIKNKSAYFSTSLPCQSTILCSRHLYERGFRYPEINHDDDAGLLQQLLSGNKMSPITAFPCYISVLSEDSIPIKSDFYKQFPISQKLSAEASALIDGVLHENISATEASERLNRSDLTQELNFFYPWSKSQPE